jgi:hypothetical protein
MAASILYVSLRRHFKCCKKHSYTCKQRRNTNYRAVILRTRVVYDELKADEVPSLAISRIQRE